MQTSEELNLAPLSMEPIPLVWLGELLISARKEQGLTQTELAERTGRHQAAIARWEVCKYRTADIQTIQTIANALSLEISVRATLK